MQPTPLKATAPSSPHHRTGIRRRIIILAEAGPVPEFLLSLVRAAGGQAVILSRLDGIFRHIKDPAEIVIVGVPNWQSEGIDAVAECRATLPDVPVIAVSGHSCDDLYLHVPASGDATRVLNQPFTPDALGIALEEVFDRPNAP